MNDLSRTAQFYAIFPCTYTNSAWTGTLPPVRFTPEAGDGDYDVARDRAKTHTPHIKKGPRKADVCADPDLQNWRLRRVFLHDTALLYSPTRDLCFYKPAFSCD